MAHYLGLLVIVFGAVLSAATFMRLRWLVLL